VPSIRLALVLALLSAPPFAFGDGYVCKLDPQAPKPPEASETGSDLWHPPLKGELSVRSGYGWRKLGGKKEFHPGLDLVAAEGTKVYAARDGVVIFAGENDDFGNVVVLKHADGTHSIYGHLSKISVKRGRKIESRTLVGLSGTTGRSTGPHLHFQVAGPDGKSVDPAPLLGLNR
jgi:murein DD-endopeptidase MepM/ murein hydrolase activator NlpD